MRIETNTAFAFTAHLAPEYWGNMRHIAQVGGAVMDFMAAHGHGGVEMRWPQYFVVRSWGSQTANAAREMISGIEGITYATEVREEVLGEPVQIRH
ncbi:hypothetical protein HYU14_06560 [Candidatus Woesearchaeota archaeon]|nr:hypothetical protein [Candidatus Woesearchaeota archaeon]